MNSKGSVFRISTGRNTSPDFRYNQSFNVENKNLVVENRGVFSPIKDSVVAVDHVISQHNILGGILQ